MLTYSTSIFILACMHGTYSNKLGTNYYLPEELAGEGELRLWRRERWATACGATPRCRRCRRWPCDRLLLAQLATCWEPFATWQSNPFVKLCCWRLLKPRRQPSRGHGLPLPSSLFRWQRCSWPCLLVSGNRWRRCSVVLCIVPRRTPV